MHKSNASLLVCGNKRKSIDNYYFGRNSKCILGPNPDETGTLALNLADNEIFQTRIKLSRVTYMVIFTISLYNAISLFVCLLHATLIDELMVKLELIH